MEIAIWIIAICEIIRAIQNIVPIINTIKNSKAQENAYSEFIKSLKKSDKEFMRDMIQEWAKSEAVDGGNDH